MSKKGYLLVGVAFLVILCLTSFLVIGQGMTGKLSRVIRDELELDSDIYKVIETEYRGQRLILIVIFGNDKALNSSLGEDIKTGLEENMSETPLAISVLTRDKEANFHPYALRVVQDNEEISPNNVIGITDNFNDGAMPERVPIEDEVFWGSKGIITLGADFDTSSSFSVKYGSSSANLSPTGREKETNEITEGKGESQGESIGETDTSSNEGEGLPESNTDSQPPSGSSSSSSSKGGGFVALLAQLGALIFITASFL